VTTNLSNIAGLKTNQNDINKQTPSLIFWIIVVVAFIWNGMGVMAYLAQAYITDETKALLPEAEQALYNDIPAWATSGLRNFCIWWNTRMPSTFITKEMGHSLFITSFIGILVHLCYNFFVSGAMEVYGPGGMIMVLAIGAFFLIWYSKKSAANDLLN